MKYSNQIEKRKINRSTSRGFSVIEVMAAIVILGFGLLGVAKLHTTMTANSLDNKSRSEALTIARSRLEEIRNYSETVASRDEFDQTYSVTAGYVNDTDVPGNIADYARNEKISLSGTNRALNVQVSWTDESGSQQLVELQSGLAWQNPRSAADVLAALNKPLIVSATGRAHLGDGVLGDGGSISGYDDGTEIFNLGNGDLGLVSGDQIVLTLEDACVADTCIDFVTVNGRVYIDRATQRDLSPGNIFIQASDAAFCQRYYNDAQGDVVVVDNDTTTVLSTANGDYDYFEYRCYVGGGWHGNIGLLLAGGIKQRDKVCMGDPVSLNQWEEPEMSVRQSIYANRGKLQQQCLYCRWHSG